MHPIVKIGFYGAQPINRQAKDSLKKSKQMKLKKEKNRCPFCGRLIRYRDYLQHAKACRA